jgi:hypothetical protein
MVVYEMVQKNGCKACQAIGYKQNITAVFRAEANV